jgi:hypothetical protein
MTKKHRIFEKVKLRPTQLRTVAERRFADAGALCDTAENERANGAMYLAGFVVECLLKAKLLDTYRWLQTAASPVGRPKDEQHLWSLCYRSHDLDEILAQLPKLRNVLLRAEQRGQLRLIESLKSICAQWTIYARYSPYAAMMSEAASFLASVEELKEWLK